MSPVMTAAVASVVSPAGSAGPATGESVDMYIAEANR